jgi:hypothetical protein
MSTECSLYSRSHPKGRAWSPLAGHTGSYHPCVISHDARALCLARGATDRMIVAKNFRLSTITTMLPLHRSSTRDKRHHRIDR